ncbi:MAG: Rho termination factor [Lapillicoccus sp.]
MARRDPGPSMKAKHLHEELRDEGNSKEKSANRQRGGQHLPQESVGRKGGEASDYDEMTKDQLITALRRH